MTTKKVFILTVFLTLACILPIFLAVIVGTLAKPQTVANNQADIPIITPSVGDYKNLLFATQNPEPVFLLVRIDAVQGAINGIFIPKDTIIIENNLPKTIEKVWLAKGPAQVKESLAQMFSLRIDNYYQIDAETFSEKTAQLGSIRVNMFDFSQINDAAIIKKFAYNGGTNDIGTQTAKLLLADIRDFGKEKSVLRAKLYTAFLHTELDISVPLSQIITDTTALTDMSAIHRQEYLQIIMFLKSNHSLKINFYCIPTNQKSDCLELVTQSTEMVQQYLM